MLFINIELDKDNGVLKTILRLFSKDRSKSSSLRFKLDSGASCSSINVKELMELGYSGDYILNCPKAEFSVATTKKDEVGEIGRRIIIPVIRSTDECLFNIVFVTHPEMYMKNLLGMNVLQMFKWDVDFDKEVFDFKVRKGYEHYMKNDNITQTIYNNEDVYRAIPDVIKNRYSTKSEAVVDNIDFLYRGLS